MSIKGLFHLSNWGKTHKSLIFWGWILALFWTAVVMISFFWNNHIEDRQMIEVAKTAARISIEKDIIYRHWNATHEGVYVPVSSKTLPNPYLDIPERDIQTSTGQLLTLINPAYMMRLVEEISSDTSSYSGHLTSLNPINPDNAADPWEEKALRAFEKGEPEMGSVEMFKDKIQYRFMLPLKIEQSCLKCHAKQDYQLGDIRGGLSVAVPMAPLQAASSKQIYETGVAHSLFWLFGLIGLLIGMWSIRSRITEQTKIENTLREKTHDLGERIKEINCLLGISKLIENKENTLDDILQGTADLIPPSWQYPEITCAGIMLGDKEYTTDNFKETEWVQSADINVNNEKVGFLDIYYLKEMPEFDEGPFLKEERNLLNAVAERLGHVVEAKNSEKKLKEYQENLEKNG